MIAIIRAALSALPVVALVLCGPGRAQVQNGGFEAPQVVGTAIAAPWNETGGAASDIVNAAAAPAGQTFGFPIEGSQWLRVSSQGTGPVAAGSCAIAALPGPSGNDTAGMVTQTFTVTGSTILGFRWDFICGETTPNITFDDFFAADLLDATVQPPALLARIVYVDTGVGECTLNGMPVPISFTALPAPSTLRELNPTGPKCASFDLSLVPGIGLGSTVTLAFVVGNRGDAGTPSFAYVDDVTLSTPAGPLGQYNSPLASMRILGIGGLSACTPPYNATVIAGGPLTITLYGTPLLPFSLFLGPTNTSNATTSIGRIDIGTPPSYGNVVPVLDGIGGTGFFGPFAKIGTSGSATFAFTVPPAAPFVTGFVIGSFQAVVALPQPPFFRTSSAIRVTVQ